MTEFLAHDDEEWRLAQWLRREKKCGPREQSLLALPPFLVSALTPPHHTWPEGTATVEGVVSGPGLANCFEFLHTAADANPLTAAEATIPRLPRLDQPAAIAAAALASEPTAVAATELMLRAFGAELRQVALRCMPSGGLYIAGGIAPKLRGKILD